MPAGGLVSAGVSGAVGLGTAIYGAIQKRKAQQEAAANKMPTYSIPTEEQDALTLAGSQAGQGMSDASRQAYLNNAGSGLAATTNAILRGGGDANSIGNAYNKYDTGINNQAIYDDQARMQHLSNLQGEFHRMSAQKDKQWQINQYAPWANKAQAIGQQLTGGQNMMMAGINTLGNSALTAADGYFKRVKALPTNTIRDPQQTIAPINQFAAEPPQWQPQNYQAPNMPLPAVNYNPGSGWNPPMSGNDPSAFSFPNYYDNFFPGH